MAPFDSNLPTAAKTALCSRKDLQRGNAPVTLRAPKEVSDYAIRVDCQRQRLHWSTQP